MWNLMPFVFVIQVCFYPFSHDDVIFGFYKVKTVLVNEFN
jgi:hypothetical protein